MTFNELRKLLEDVATQLEYVGAQDDPSTWDETAEVKRRVQTAIERRISMKTQDVMKLVRSYGDLREVREPTKAMTVLIEAAAMNLTRDARRWAVIRHLSFAPDDDEVTLYVESLEAEPTNREGFDHICDLVAKQFPKVFK